MKTLLTLLITLSLCYKMNMMSQNMEEGNCYTYTLLNKSDQIFGFTLINIIKKKNGSIDHYDFALVNLNNNKEITLDEFTKGSLFSSWIPESGGKKTLGIFCYTFKPTDKLLLDNFKYIGRLNVDKSKFVVGSGTTAFPEPFFSNILGHTEETKRSMEKTVVSFILNSN